MGNPVIPSLRLEFHADALVFLTMAKQLTDSMAVGATPKAVYRKGLDRVFTFGELFSGGGTLDVSNNPDFKAAADNTYLGLGADLGIVYRLPFLPAWQPRLGAAMLNVGSSSEARGA